MINTTTKGVPQLLTSKFDDNQKDIAEKAVALYIKDHDMKPKQFATSDFKIKWLLDYLKQVSPLWRDIPIE